MNFQQLYEKCVNLFDALQSLKSDYDSARRSASNTYNNASDRRKYSEDATNYKERYSKIYPIFYASSENAMKRLASLFDDYKWEYDDSIDNFDYWSVEWRKFVSQILLRESKSLHCNRNTPDVNLEAVFENIKEILIREISTAKSSIFIAVSWFTDEDIIKSVNLKAEEHINVQIILSDSVENFETLSFLDELENKGAKIWVVKEKNMGGMLHHKFCVVDSKNVISGSYNWSRRAPFNLENILIIRNNVDIADQYTGEFYRLKNIPETIRYNIFKQNKT